jgi:hypothetical protein
MQSNSPIQIQEELESEKRFSLFSFYTQWSVYSVFFVFPIELNPIIFITGFLFSFFRLFAILQKKPKKQIYILNHLANFFLVCFFTFIFSAIPKTDLNVVLNWQLYYVALAFTIIHESMRVHKYAYIYKRSTIIPIRKYCNRSCGKWVVP